MTEIRLSPRALLITSVVLVALVSGLVYQAYARGAWKERARDLEAQVELTDVLLDGYAINEGIWAERLDSLANVARESNLTALEQARTLRIAQRDREVADSEIVVLRSVVDETALSGEVRDLLEGERVAAERARDETVACRLLLNTQMGLSNTCATQRGVLEGQVSSLSVLRGRLVAERDSALALMKPPPILDLTMELTIGPGILATMAGQVYAGIGLQLSILKFRF